MDPLQGGLHKHDEQPPSGREGGDGPLQVAWKSFSVREEKGSGGRCFSREEAGQGWCSQHGCLQTHREASMPHDAHQQLLSAKPTQQHPSQALGSADVDFSFPREGRELPRKRWFFVACLQGAQVVGSSFSVTSPSLHLTTVLPKARCPRIRLPAHLWLSPSLSRYLLRLCLTRRDTLLLPPHVCIPPGKPL